ncbi:MAG: pyruvate kinase [Acidobacteriota bacterium]
MKRRAKILATIGPASSSETMLKRLLKAGADNVRLNQSHGTPEEHREMVRRVRRVSMGLDRFVGIVVDLMGPRYRLDVMEEPRRLRRGEQIVFGVGDDVDVPIGDEDVLDHLKRGERVLVDNGLIELKVLRKRGTKLWAEVVQGGTVSSRKGINLPDSRLPFEISDKDRRDIAMAVEEKADYVAASYVGSAADVDAIRREIQACKGDQPIISKLERRQAVENLDEIVQASDAVMVARGDLGVEVPLHEVPVIQKRIIEAGWRHARPVIVATQMLESMMEHPRPTRAESSDVANAVFDGADALMLSGESAAGSFPVEAVATMDRIICEAESYLRTCAEEDSEGNSLGRRQFFDIEPPGNVEGTQEMPETISSAAVQSARQLGARCIVALTAGGFTARMLACRRPSSPVIALTQKARTARRLQLVWGIQAVAMKGDVAHHDEVVGLVDRHLLAAKVVKPGDRIAILMGDPIQERPPTNLLRLHHVRRRPRKAKS